MNGKWRIRLGAGCEVAEYWYSGEIRGVLVRAIGTDKWIPKIGGVPVGTPACKGKSENVLRDRIRSGKESSDMAKNTMTKAELIGIINADCRRRDAPGARSSPGERAFT